MPVIRQDDAQKLLDQIDLLRKLITEQATNAYAISTAIEPSLLRIKQEFGVDAQGKIQQPVWNAIAQEGRERLYQRLFNLVERLTRAVFPDPEGPLTKNSIMYYKHAPDWAIWAVMVGAIMFTLGVLWEISTRWEKATRRESIANAELHRPEPVSMPLKPQPSSSVKNPNQAIPAKKQSGPAPPASKSVADPSVIGTPTPNEPTHSKPVAIPPTPQGSAEQRAAPAPEPSQSNSEGHNAESASSREPATEIDVLIMVMLMGTLGGLLRLISSFAKYVGNRQLLQSWMIYYILMPLESAALVPLVYLLLRVGVLAPAQVSGSPLGMNLYGIYAIAGMTGLFSKQAMDMLAEVFAVIFKKVKAKDDLESAKAEKE